MSSGRLSVGVVGGSGYVGGELVRLIEGHPDLHLLQVTSESLANTYVHHKHPNLRGQRPLKFRSIRDLEPCDVLFVGLPHGKSGEYGAQFESLCTYMVDLGADHRLRDPELRNEYYPRLAEGPPFVYGLPELNRSEIEGARRVAGPGCTAAATILALLPLARAGVLSGGPVVVEVKVGSSAAGASVNPSTHHPERSGVMRSFAPAGHRHEAEVVQALDLAPGTLHYSATAVEAVRGVLATAHCFPAEALGERDLWRIYRESYRDEPFVRIVREKRGLYRYPEPKILSGTNFCEVGFALDPRSDRIVAMAALDNLGKGAAGGAIQSLNLMAGLPEARGLEFIGLHP